MKKHSLPPSPHENLRCLLVSPEFPKHSFWNWTSVCEIRDEKAMGLPLGLLTLAAILPQNWKFRLVDLNTRKLHDSDIRWADMVCVGGMGVQQGGTLNVMRRASEHGKFVVVGGSDPTSQPTVYQHADALVLGEAETNVPIWLTAWEQGSPRGTFQGGDVPDVTKSPIPRFDLARLNDYLCTSIQYSRGCPFNCEFCSITELFGRRPRTKTPDQICRELEALYRLGYRGWVDFVDDNFIGNKRDVKRMLPVVADWSKQRRYPFFFSTEASLNLAEDSELMNLMVAADFRYFFTGIESPEEKVLHGAQKKVNTQRSLNWRIRRLNEHGLLVTAGFVLGLDGESDETADAILACVKENALPLAMISLLTALPMTQLTRRLLREGRLMDLAGNHVGPDQVFELREDQWNESIHDQAVGGLNFVTSRDRNEIMRDQMRIIDTLYDPANYLARAAEAVRRIRPAWKHQPCWSEIWTDILGFFRLIVKISRRREVRGHFWRFLWQSAKQGKAKFDLAAALATLYLHFLEMRTQLIGGLQRRCQRELTDQAPTVARSSERNRPRRAVETAATSDDRAA